MIADPLATTRTPNVMASFCSRTPHRTALGLCTPQHIPSCRRHLRAVKASVQLQRFSFTH